VVSSITGASLAVLVTEPTPSGRHDLARVAALCDHFKLPTAVLINKADLNPDEAAHIENACADAGRPILGRLPYSPDVVAAMAARLTLPEYGGPLAAALQEIWTTVERLATTPKPNRNPF
jgi:MinD superfamily P-loop ATPase